MCWYQLRMVPGTCMEAARGCTGSSAGQSRESRVSRKVPILTQQCYDTSAPEITPYTITATSCCLPAHEAEPRRAGAVADKEDAVVDVLAAEDDHTKGMIMVH